MNAIKKTYYILLNVRSPVGIFKLYLNVWQTLEIGGLEVRIDCVIYKADIMH